MIFSGTAAYAQDTITFASVSGRVTDPSGSVIAGAHVSARRTETNRTAATLTDREGRFRLPYLKVGAYEVTVSHPGFAQAMRPVTLTVGSAFELAIELTVAGEQSTVTVGAEAAVVETARTQIAGTVSQAEVQSLPLNGRNFLDLALLVPGVSPTNTASNQLFAETSAVPGQGISVGSQRNFSNNFIVDGLSANDDAAGLSGDLLRPGCGAGIPGGDVGRPGGVGPRARRLHQHGHQERHQRRCMAISTATSAISASTPPTRCPTPSCLRRRRSTARASAAR